jgi:F-type H+/Na+-transporting ATPase subunit beta
VWRRCPRGARGNRFRSPKTVRGFKEILDGQHDAVPEDRFYMKGGINEVIGEGT